MAEFIGNVADWLMRTQFVIASAAWQSRWGQDRRYTNGIATSLRSSQ